MLELDALSPDFLERFAEEKSRSRRYVARKPADLYASASHLARAHGQHLKNEWYFDTNLSAEQVALRARAAARIAGLNYGRDVKLMDNLRLI